MIDMRVIVSDVRQMQIEIAELRARVQAIDTALNLLSDLTATIGARLADPGEDARNGHRRRRIASGD